MKKTRVSSSLIDGFHWCERKYRIKVIEKIPSGIFSIPLNLGGLCHDQINLFWKTFKLNIDTYKQDIKNYYRKSLSMTRDVHPDIYVLFQVYFSNFLNFQIRRINRYIEIYGKDHETIRKYFFPIISEEYNIINITDDIEFAFVIDALFETPKGNLLIDWKTDKDCNEGSFKSHLPQLNRYTSGLKRIGENNEFIGIFFLKESLLFKDKKTVGYSLEDDILSFLRELQVSKFPKVPKHECWKCYSNNYECEYFPDICSGVYEKKEKIQ